MASSGYVFCRVCVPFLAGCYLSYVHRATNAALGAEIALHFQLTAAQLGFLTSVFFLATATFQLPLGVLLDRFGPRRVNGVLLALGGLGAGVAALSTSYSLLIVSRFLIGLGTAACFMAAIQAFVLWYPADRTATMVSLTYSVGAIGIMTVGTPLELLLRYASWRDVFWILSGSTVALSAVFALLVPERVSAPRGQSIREQIVGIKRIITDRGFWWISLSLAASQGATVSLLSLWMATWLRDVAQLDRAAVGVAILLAAFAQLVGYVVFGRLADARTRRGESSLPLFAGGTAIAAIFLALLAFGYGTAAVGVWILYAFFGTAGPLGLSIGVRRYPAAMAASVNTAANTVTITTIFLVQWGIGAILALWPATAAGYAPAAYSWALGILCALQFAALLWLWMGRHDVEQRARMGSPQSHQR